MCNFPYKLPFRQTQSIYLLESESILQPVDVKVGLPTAQTLGDHHRSGAATPTNPLVPPQNHLHFHALRSLLPAGVAELVSVVVGLAALAALPNVRHCAGFGSATQLAEVVLWETEGATALATGPHSVFRPVRRGSRRDMCWH